MKQRRPGGYIQKALDMCTVQHQLYQNLASNGKMHTSLLVTDKYVCVVPQTDIIFGFFFSQLAILGSQPFLLNPYPLII